MVEPMSMKGLEQAIEAAQQELSKKSLRVIQTDTATKWLARAIVAQRMGKTDDVHEYAHEALEHAALASNPRLIDEVRAFLRQAGIKP